MDAITALRRIASGQTPSENPKKRYGFAQMSRREMVDLARAACAELGIPFSTKVAWEGFKWPTRLQKLHLAPRQSLAEVKIPRKIYQQQNRAA